MQSTRTSQTILGRLGLALAFTAVLAIAQRAEAQTTPKKGDFADFLFIVDESGSMYSGHDWLYDMAYELEEKLQLRGLGVGTETNRYGLVGFGSFQPAPRSFDLDPFTPGNQQFGSVSQFAQASLSLVKNGGIEDGYDGIHFGLSNYEFRPGAAINLVLVTDDYRDVVNPGLSFQSIFDEIQSHNALLNVVVNHPFQDASGNRVIGVDAKGNAFIADGEGFTVSPYIEPTAPAYDDFIPSNPISSYSISLEVDDSRLFSPEKINFHVPSPRNLMYAYELYMPHMTYMPYPDYSLPSLVWGNWFSDKTKEDYIDLAWKTGNDRIGGAAWDINILRMGGTAVTSFTDAFTTVKAEEAYQQTVPEPNLLLGILVLGASGLIGRAHKA